MEKFGGVGLVNIIIIWLMVILLTVGSKVVFTKYHVAGISELIQAV